MELKVENIRSKSELKLLNEKLSELENKTEDNKMNSVVIESEKKNNEQEISKNSKAFNEIKAVCRKYLPECLNIS